VTAAIAFLASLALDAAAITILARLTRLERRARARAAHPRIDIEWGSDPDLHRTCDHILAATQQREEEGPQ
jgi:hypothetical protein